MVDSDALSGLWCSGWSMSIVMFGVQRCTVLAVKNCHCLLGWAVTARDAHTYIPTQSPPPSPLSPPPQPATMLCGPAFPDCRH